MSAGVDYSFNPHPSPAALKAAGATFVMRYTSSYMPNDGNGKNLLKAELEALLAEELAVGIVVEEGSGGMQGGQAAGVAAAQHADAASLGTDFGQWP